MADVTEDPLIVTDENTQVDIFTPTNTHGPVLLPVRRILNFAPPSTPEHEAMQEIKEQAKKNEQRLENLIDENEHLRQDLASEVAKSKQAVP